MNFVITSSWRGSIGLTIHIDLLETFLHYNSDSDLTLFFLTLDLTELFID